MREEQTGVDAEARALDRVSRSGQKMCVGGL